MTSAVHASFLPPIVTFCAAAVVAVPVARRLGLGSVLGYLAAGVAIGPFGLRLINDTDAVRTVAEIGVVLLLFVIGLELKFSKLVALRREIFGVGSVQLLTTALVIGAGAYFGGLPTGGPTIVGLSLALSATAVALQILGERGDLQTPYGQRTFAVLLFQDLSIVPILALVPVLASAAGIGAPEQDTVSLAVPVAKAIGALAFVVFIGRFLLNPMFQALAVSGAREVMTAAALLVVLGAAYMMEQVGLSMALGAFLAGVMLAESNFRHQLEADIEPFRGLLLGLFFMSVGMSIDLKVVLNHGLALGLISLGLCLAKSLIAFFLFRFTGSPASDAARGAILLAPAGEFSFVILPLAAASGLIGQEQATLLTAVAALTMFLGPLLAKGVDAILSRWAASRPTAAADLPEEPFDGSQSSVLVVGFGRFGQVVNQVLLANGVDVTVIDRNVERIREASRFGFKVFYGDGTRIDVLRAAGAEQARVIAICIDDKDEALQITHMVHANFPDARSYVRAYDRRHAIELMNAQVDFHMRETFESAISFGRATLEELGIEPQEARDIAEDVRKRDVVRLTMQQAEGMMGGADLLHGVTVHPEPLMKPKARSQALSAETRALIEDEGGRR